MAYKLDPPEKFDVSQPKLWRHWKARFERFRQASKLSAEDEADQVNALLYIMGPHSETIFNSFTYDATKEESAKKYNCVLKKMDAYFTPKVNLIEEQRIFHLLKQESGESVDDLLRKLYDRAEICDFHDKEKEIMHQFIVGMANTELSGKIKIMDYTKLTLSKVIEMARIRESVMSSSQSNPPAKLDYMRGKPSASRGGYSRGGYNSAKKPAGRPNQNSSGSKDDKTCGKCMSAHPHNKCPAYGQQCLYCKKIGHFKRACLKLKNKQLREMEGNTGGYGGDGNSVDDINQDPDAFLGSLTASAGADYMESQDGEVCLNTVSVNDNEPVWFKDIKVNNQDVCFKIDTGADVSVLPLSEYKKIIPPPPLQKSKVNLKSPGGKVKCIGVFTAMAVVDGSQYKIRLHVIDAESNTCLLSRGCAIGMGLVKRLNNIEQRYDDVFGEVGNIKCKPVSIKLKENVVPYSVSVSRRVSLPLMSKVKDKLAKLCKQGVISKVTEPTEWCAPMVAVEKKSDPEPRICVDLRQLNKNIEREKFILPTTDDTVHKMSGSTVFSVLDASSSFWGLTLDETSSLLTTFMSPFGRYKFNRVPFGLNFASELYQRVMSELFEGVEGAEIVIDDIIVHGKNQAEHDFRLEKVLNIIRENGIKLNRKKCKFSQAKVTFTGFEISKDGIKPTGEHVKAILALREPENVSELRRVLGMTNFLSRFIPDMANVAAPLYDLLRKDVMFVWDSKQQKAFDSIKQTIKQAQALPFYNPNKPTVVSADACNYGIGACLWQMNDNVLKPICFASRTLNAAEKKYAMIEKECLALVWACEHFSRFLVGLPHFSLHSDHKPLIPLINSKDLDQAPVRCQRLLIRLMRFNAEAVYVPGKDMVIPDTLSRDPMSGECGDCYKDVEQFLMNVETDRPIADYLLQQISEETNNDSELQTVQGYIMKGWPTYFKEVPMTIQSYFREQNMLSVVNGLVLFGKRIVVPQSMRAQILDRIHDGHLGITKCRMRAQNSVWWPGISSDINLKVANCKHCLSNRNTQKREPLMPTPMPSRPWSKVAADLCEYQGKQWLVVMDYYSRYPEVVQMGKSTTAKAVIDKLKGIFARFGIPETLISDNGPQFDAQEFADFSVRYNFEHLTVSPHFPQANGQVERGVQILKAFLCQDDPFLALLSYRSTPHSATGVSPAHLLMGRQIRSTLPTLPSNLDPGWPDLKQVRKNDDIAKANYKYYYDRRHNAKPLAKLAPGESVNLKLDGQKGWKTHGVVIKQHDAPRSYFVKTDDGATYRRNRVHLMPVPDEPDSDAVPLLVPPIAATQPESTLNIPQSSSADPMIPQMEPPITHSAPPPVPEPTRVPPARIIQTRLKSGINVAKPARYND
jgi:hypothetical protein